MTLPELGIKRFVMAFMVGSAVVLFGIVSYFRIGIAQFPNVDFPIIIVAATQDGADADVMDNTVTSILMDKLNGIAGIDTITASSSAGVSAITITFELEKNVDIAFNEVQSRVNQALPELPSGIDSPSILKASSTSDPILQITVSGNRTIQQINEYASEIIKKKLEIVDGVSEVQIFGERDRQIRVNIDIQKLASYGIGITDLINAFTDAHVQMPAGYIIKDKTELLLNLNFEAHKIDEFNSIVIKNNNGAFVRLGDIATVVDGLDEFRKFSSYDSKPSVTLGITSIAGSNAFDIEKGIMDRLDSEILPNLEPGIKLNITENTVNYIRDVVNNLKEHLILGVVLTSAIVYLFLRNLTSTIIVSCSIPISLFGAIIVMYAFGYTFNMITLLGLLLLIGIVVDDAIIVLENIYRRVENGEEPSKASLSGSNQVVFAVLASTLSLVSIFGPVIFMAGIVGKFFQSFAIVVTFGVVISYLVSMYITPMLCSRYLRKSKGREGIIKQGLEKGFKAIEFVYRKLLGLALNNRIITLLIAIGVFVSVFFVSVPVEFISSSDKSEFRVFVRTAPGANIYATLEKIREVEDILRKYKEVKEFVSSIGNNDGPVNRARISVNMVDLKDRDISQVDFVRKIQKDLNKIVGATVIASSPSAVGGDDYGFTFNVNGPSVEKVYEYSLKIQSKLSQDERFGNMDLDMNVIPQLRMNPDRDKIALLNLTSNEVLQSIRAAVGGIKVGKYSDLNGSKRYDIVMKVKDSQINSIDSLDNIYIKSSTNQLIRLDNVVTPEEYLGFGTIKRNGSLYSAQLSGNPSVATGDVIPIAQKIAEEILPAGYSISFEGQTKQLQKTITNMLFVFVLAIILLYMVLASQFNSFIQPLIIMVSVPLAIVGGIYGLFVTGFSMNMFSMIGTILLVGLVAKNAILLIDFTNEIRRNENKSVKEALLEACPIRLRPILMTSLTVVLSMLPAAISRGAGSENNASMSIVVIGGILSSTLLTLIVIPSLYSVVEGFTEKRKNKKRVKISQGK